MFQKHFYPIKYTEDWKKFNKTSNKFSNQPNLKTETQKEKSLGEIRNEKLTNLF